MSTTFGELKNRVSTVLSDPDHVVFTEPLVEELIQSALVEVGRIAPEQFVEDLTPVDYQTEYQPRADTFSAVQVAGITGEADTELFTLTNHGMNDGLAVTFASLSGGTGLSTTTTYFVIEAADDTFQLSTSVGGSAAAFSTDVTDATLQLVGSGTAVPELEVMRVEVWDTTQDPERFIYRIPPASYEYNSSDSGWSFWGGQLTLPGRVVNGLVGYDTSRVIRVWGYSPYVPPLADGDVVGVSHEVEQAMLWHCRYEALDMLTASRDLYTQWQTRPGNTDTSLAGLNQQKSFAEQTWVRRSRAITRLRSEV